MSRTGNSDFSELTWTAKADGLRFRVVQGPSQVVDPSQWGASALSHETGRASVAPLLALIEDGVVAPSADLSLLIPHPIAAGWDRHQIAQLGLPPIAPFHLNIQGRGSLTSPGFRFRHQLETDKGLPVMGAGRQGVVLTVGAKRFVLLDPLYSLIEGMERYNATPESDIDARFAAWGALQALLPEGAVVDQQLRSMNIVRADALTLDPRAGDRFDPVLLQNPDPGADVRELGAPSQPCELLAPAAQRDFAERFNRLSQAKPRYALPGNWFVMVAEPLRQVLGVVREMQDALPERRRAFLANPHAVIGERLGDRLAAEVIEGLFHETPAFLSQRVECIGEWHPKLHAFVPGGMTDWFPSDETGERPGGSEATGDSRRESGVSIGVPTSAGVIQAQLDDVARIVEQIRAGREAGQSAVEWNGQQIPTDEVTEEAFARVAQSKRSVRVTMVPLIKDNIEDLAFVAPQRHVTGAPGGLPAALASELFPHQRDGLDWLQRHWAGGSPGSLLADDMGLGKTLQTLAFLSWVGEQTDGDPERKPHLIVAPTGLLKNWEAEADQHLVDPGLGELFRAYGPDLATLRNRPGNERRRYLRDRARWVLTTYETLRDKIELFVDVPWRVVVFDEAQRIKNPGARVTDMAKSLDADLTLALTGTPVENSLSDLWCIVDAVRPGFLGSHTDFKRTYAKPAEADATAMDPLKQKLEQETQPPVLLRRMKQDHLDGLPAKHVHREERPMPPTQAQAYDAVVRQAHAGTGQPGAVLEALQHLRRVSLLPGDGDEEGITDQTVAQSARLGALVEILDRIADTGEKVLAFIEYLKVQEALIPYLRQRYSLDRDPLRIHGGTPGARRKQHVDTFQGGPEGIFDVMLLSPKAAGVGLTLTAANHVIHLSRWWNPAVEDQCTDRVYRIGQRRDVHVHLPIAVHPSYGDRSFDLNLHRLLERKRTLSANLFASPVASPEELSRLAEESMGRA